MQGRSGGREKRGRMIDVTRGALTNERAWVLSAPPSSPIAQPVNSSQKDPPSQKKNK